MNNPIRLLLVDDNLYFLNALRDFLRLQRAYEVTGTATKAQYALAQAQRTQPDIILLDLNLRDESGLELIPGFKKHLPATKIVALLLMNNESYRVAAMQNGADAFLHKKDILKKLDSIIFELTDVE